MNKIRIIIDGSRTFDDYAMLCSKCEEVFQDLIECKKLCSLSQKDISNITIISGMAKGADLLGMKYAVCKNMGLKIMPADWNVLGKRAGYVRNEEMVKFASEEGITGVLLAFWDGNSKGTKHMINIAEQYGLLVYKYMF